MEKRAKNWEVGLGKRRVGLPIDTTPPRQINLNLQCIQFSHYGNTTEYLISSFNKLIIFVLVCNTVNILNKVKDYSTSELGGNFIIRIFENIE